MRTSASLIILTLNGKILNNESYKELFKPQLTDVNYTERNESVYNDEYNMVFLWEFLLKDK